MTASEAIRMALTRSKTKQVELAKVLGIRPQPLNLKLKEGRWTWRDLAKTAEYTGGKLAILYPDGTQFPIDAPEEEQE